MTLHWNQLAGRWLPSLNGLTSDAIRFCIPFLIKPLWVASWRFLNVTMQKRSDGNGFSSSSTSATFVWHVCECAKIGLSAQCGNLTCCVTMLKLVNIKAIPSTSCRWLLVRWSWKWSCSCFGGATDSVETSSRGCRVKEGDTAVLDWALERQVAKLKSVLEIISF